METDELKNIWKEQKAEGKNTSGNIYESIMEVLKKAERKTFARYILMTIFVAITIYTLGGKVLSLKHYQPLTYAGIYLLFAAMITVLIFVWSTIIIPKNKKISSPSIEFIKSIQVKFRRRRLIRRIVIPVYIAAIIVGVTLVYLEVLQDLTILNRILIHIGVIIFLLLLSWFASAREKKRYEKIYKPIEERIDELLEDYNKKN